jgi:hypothetical protein
MIPSSRLLAAALLLAAWMGASLLTVAVVAPGAFAVLPSRTIAGVMVGRVLPMVFGAGLALGVVVAVAAGVRAASPGAAITALLASSACAVALFGINPRIARLRAEIGGPVDALSMDDPRRVAFGLLHGYSVAGLGVAMLAALVSLSFLVVALRPRS